MHLGTRSCLTTTGNTAAIWLRSLVHYIFLADSRTDRVIGEPKESNIAIIKTAVNASFHVHTVKQISTPGILESDNVGYLDRGFPIQEIGAALESPGKIFQIG
jgi:hypothetical protein